jgi:putative exosortase-associated protein (TIGR04073 family)
MMRNVVLPLAILIAICFSTVEQAKADEYQQVEESAPQEIVDGMANKLARGLANVAVGWLEFPKQIYLTTKEEGLAKGLTIGSLRGAGMTVGRTISGAGETATFFISYPGFFDPYFDPPYPWQGLPCQDLPWQGPK